MYNTQKSISSLVGIIIVVAFAIIVGGGIMAYQYGWQSKPSATTGPKDETAGWKTYTNTQYGFSIQYPSNYKPADDQYGWPNATILFSGPSGQSYYLAIEVWNNESEFNAARGYNMEPQPVFKQIGNQYISLWNVNKDPVVDQIISTFKFTK